MDLLRALRFQRFRPARFCQSNMLQRTRHWGAGSRALSRLGIMASGFQYVQAALVALVDATRRRRRWSPRASRHTPRHRRCARLWGARHRGRDAVRVSHAHQRNWTSSKSSAQRKQGTRRRHHCHIPTTSWITRSDLVHELCLRP